jgi:hypothetical protein
MLRSANAGNVYRHLASGRNIHSTVGRRVASVCCRRAPPNTMAIQTAHLKKMRRLQPSIVRVPVSNTGRQKAYLIPLSILSVP